MKRNDWTNKLESQRKIINFKSNFYTIRFLKYISSGPMFGVVARIGVHGVLFWTFLCWHQFIFSIFVNLLIIQSATQAKDAHAAPARVDSRRPSLEEQGQHLLRPLGRQRAGDQRREGLGGQVEEQQVRGAADAQEDQRVHLGRRGRVREELCRNIREMGPHTQPEHGCRGLARCRHRAEWLVSGFNIDVWKIYLFKSLDLFQRAISRFHQSFWRARTSFIKKPL